MRPSAGANAGAGCFNVDAVTVGEAQPASVAMPSASANMVAEAEERKELMAFSFLMGSATSSRFPHVSREERRKFRRS